MAQRIRLSFCTPVRGSRPPVGRAITRCGVRAPWRGVGAPMTVFGVRVGAGVSPWLRRVMVILVTAGNGSERCVVRRRGFWSARRRRWVAAAGCWPNGWPDGGVDDGDAASVRVADVLLAASEVLGNAARLCDGPIDLAVEAHRDELRVAVTDDHPGRALVQHAGPFEESGRGLLLVDAVVDRWARSRSPMARPWGGVVTGPPAPSHPPGAVAGRLGRSKWGAWRWGPAGNVRRVRGVDARI